MQQDAGDESESQEAVENLLESYFMQIDSTHDRLDAIGEYIEDTEEYPPPPLSTTFTPLPGNHLIAQFLIRLRVHQGEQSSVDHRQHDGLAKETLCKRPPPQAYYCRLAELVDFLNLLGQRFPWKQSLHDFVQVPQCRYINIELDSSRNRLLRLEIVLTAGTFGIAMFGLVAGILGENLIIPRAITKDIMGFVLVNVGTFIFCLLLFLGVMCYIKYRRLM